MGGGGARVAHPPCHPALAVTAARIDAGRMKTPSRDSVIGLVILVAPTVIAFVWGLSWATGDYPECASGSSFLADMGWSLGGIGLGLLAGIVVPIVATVARSYAFGVLATVVAGGGMWLAANVGAELAARIVGCDAWHVRDAGGAVALGIALAGVPILVVTGVVVGIAAIARSQRPPPDAAMDDVDGPTDDEGAPTDDEDDERSSAELGGEG